jgi:hypothetical protein
MLYLLKHFFITHFANPTILSSRVLKRKEAVQQPDGLRSCGQTRTNHHWDLRDALSTTSTSYQDNLKQHRAQTTCPRHYFKEDGRKTVACEVIIIRSLK